VSHQTDLFLVVARLLEAYLSGLRRTVRKNLSRLTCAFLRLALSLHFGYGGLHLTSVAGVLPEGREFKSSYKWLSRFLKSKYFDRSGLAECMLALMLGEKPPPWVIVSVDQTRVNGVQLVHAAVPFRGEPCASLGWVLNIAGRPYNPPSQNILERYLLTWLAGRPPPAWVRLILVFDRGYARVELIKDLDRGRQPFLIRAPSQVIVQAQVRGRRQRLSLGRLPHRSSRPIHYRHAFYCVVCCYLERRPQPPLTLQQVDPLIRELTHYRNVIQQRMQEQEKHGSLSFSKRATQVGAEDLGEFS
jgi:hypothetical protein